ncbi:MAG: WXG100 family type VII secretion target [Candidatus Dormibacteraeota bacterium]|nr:WXG100 family type VII secretion target [Candidatus Dormibacteraeota bacterium]
MAGGFHVEKGTFAQCARQVQEQVPEMHGLVSRLNAEMEGLFGTWQGSAAGGFQALHGRLQDDFGQLHISLQGIGEGLQRNWQNYVNADERSR